MPLVLLLLLPIVLPRGRPPAMARLLATLLPHQEAGLAWCRPRERQGCILADDMGLGKTVMSCALLVAQPAPTLIIAPLALLAQWQAEIAKHTEGLTTVIYHGPQRAQLLPRVATADVVITTPHTIMGDFRARRHEFCQRFERLIVDEAHKLKNIKTSSHACIYTVFRETPRKLLLTGTPVCNNINDVVALLMLLNVEPYNTGDYWHGMHVDERITTIMELKPRFLLHRTKEDTIKQSLQPINIQTVKLDLQNQQQKQKYTKLFRTKFSCKLEKILRMRQCMNDVKLVKNVPEDAEETTATDSAALWERLSEEVAEKVMKIQRILDKIPAGDKVVVFSQWTSMLEILAALIELPHVLYHGGLETSTKTAVLDRFKTDPAVKILFITLKCGGCGLNLNVANHAIIVEPYFNHAEERQAIDRIYRLGQTKEVFVYKLRITATVENWMRQLQSVKFSLANLVLRDQGSAAEIKNNRERTSKMFAFFINQEGEFADELDI